MEECGPCRVFASFRLVFALQLRKKHGKTSVRVFEECRFVTKKVCTTFSRTSYKMVFLTNLNKYLYSDRSKIKVNI